MSKIRKDYYVITSGKPLKLFGELVDEAKRLRVESIEFAGEFGCTSFGSPDSPFSELGYGGLKALAFKCEKPPKGWKKHPRFSHSPGVMGCIPTKTKEGKLIQARMDLICSKISPMPLYKLFGYDGENAMIGDGNRWYMCSGGTVAGKKLVIIPKKSETEPTKAPRGSKRIEEWEYMKIQHETK